MAEPEPRPVVQEFAKMMETVLRHNDWKGGWESMSEWDIIRRMSQELDELHWEISRYFYDRSRFDGERVIKETADLANFAAFLLEKRQKI